MNSFEGAKMAIWDLDGTINDSFGIFRDIVKEAAELSGHAVPDDTTIHKNFHGSLDETIGAIFDLTDDPASIEALVNDFLRFQERYYEQPNKHVFPDSLRLAKRLHDRDIDQVVVTNRTHEGRGSASPRYLIDNSAMKPLIGDIVCRDDVRVAKPDPMVIDGLMQQRPLRPDELIVIGDQFVDAKLAQNLGCRAILISRNPEPIPHLDELGPNQEFLTIVRSLDEVQ